MDECVQSSGLSTNAKETKNRENFISNDTNTIFISNVFTVATALFSFDCILNASIASIRDVR